MGAGQLSGQVRGEFFGVGSSGSEEQHRAQTLGQCLGTEAGPVAADLRGQAPVQFIGEDLVERHRTHRVLDHLHGPAQTPQPVRHLPGIGHRSAEEQELGLGGGQGQGEFVVQSPVLVAEHLVLVDHQQGGAIAADQAVLLGLEGGDEDGGVEVLGQVTGGDAHVPATRPPFGEFVIGQGPRRHRVDGLPAVLARLRPQFEHQRLACPGGRVDDHILAGPQRRDRLLLPQVGNDELLQTRGRIGGFGGGCKRRHPRRLRPSAKSTNSFQGPVRVRRDHRTSGAVAHALPIGARSCGLSGMPGWAKTPPCVRLRLHPPVVWS